MTASRRITSASPGSRFHGASKNAIVGYRLRSPRLLSRRHYGRRQPLVATHDVEADAHGSANHHDVLCYRRDFERTTKYRGRCNTSVSAQSQEDRQPCAIQRLSATLVCPKDLVATSGASPVPPETERHVRPTLRCVLGGLTRRFHSRRIERVADHDLANGSGERNVIRHRVAGRGPWPEAFDHHCSPQLEYGL